MVIPKNIQRLYPFESKYFYLPDEKDNYLHYVDEGKGSPIFFVHGNYLIWGI